MGIKKCDAKYTKPFVGKTNVIVMMAVEGGESTASATQLDYDMVHALEKMIVDCTFIDDEPQTNCKTCRHWRCNYEECGEIECKYEPKDEPQTEYERASEQREHDILYEPTYDVDNGSM